MDGITALVADGPLLVAAAVAEDEAGAGDAAGAPLPTRPVT